MEFVGSIPKPIWDKALDISRKESFPVEQPDNCPYIILTHLSNKQLLALTGTLKKQHIDLCITDVYPPSEHTEHIIPDYADTHRANRLIWQLISKALTSFLQTSSIDK